jgi:hypothetical protein
MSGLYIKNNLRESGLNKTEAVQNLYGPGIQNDMRLFGFSDSIFSDFEPFKLINQPFVDSSGLLIKRTKFASAKGFTFANENRVWIDSVQNEFDLDKRTESELLEGSKIYFSKDGSLSAVEIVGTGSGYQVITAQGDVIPGISEVVVGVEGQQSGAKNALIKIFINSDTGSVVSQILPEIINPGTGYFLDEELFILPHCQDFESPETSKCLQYGEQENKLIQVYFSPVAFPATLKSSVYEYIVRDSDEEGFFLFDGREQKWMFLGEIYNSGIDVNKKIKLKRSDRLSVFNFLNLEKLSGRSSFFNYDNQYNIQGALVSGIDRLVGDVVTIIESLNSLYQDVKRQRFENDPLNEIGTKINLYEGGNINTSFRIILRDPDGILDLDKVDFFSLRDSLSGPDEIELEIPSIQQKPLRIPGIWINVGGNYRRAFSSDDKAFQSLKGREFLSPMIFKIESGETNYQTASLVERAEVGENKYSLSASYLKFEGTTVLGFDTTISTLVQNLSGAEDPKNGGITYHSAIIPEPIRPGIQAWPLFKTEVGKFAILAV